MIWYLILFELGVCAGIILGAYCAPTNEVQA